MADGLADKGREKRAGDAKHRSQDESAGIVRPRRKQPRLTVRYDGSKARAHFTSLRGEVEI
jgi:hypothetical protein